ncbi:TcpE family conjugal transfer membrane protein [Nonomuraea angiospora]|uniref:TcpE family conjugal transfer membrane protein n=1 Tax=Nonomuraea angiospora TaxID=46172 RepID=UPI0029BD7003|nr:TcpE family conjugal transfer membrane protein [Nonomuraea angiospora]MDX3103308.1 TcpE family conjugal transfer membrane protein [Nonomuraea angiospora]
MDLPTYTNIWRIEKRLYKLYDLRLPMPLPIVWIGVFVGVFVPWSLLLVLVGVPVEMPWHVLYLVPPGIVTWLSTRPVIEGKRLTELLESQLRYLGQPKAWYRLAPTSEAETITFSARVWRTTPARAKSKAPRKARQPQRRREGQRIAGPRQVRPAVAAAAAAASQAPVAEPTTGRWGTRRGTAPALKARVRETAPPSAPRAGVGALWREEALPGGPGRHQDALPPGTHETSEPPTRESVDARNAAARERGTAEGAAAWERGAARDAAAWDRGAAADAAASPDDARADHEATGAAGSVRETETHKPTAGKPIDTEALRRLRRLAASADAPAAPSVPAEGERRDRDEERREERLGELREERPEERRGELDQERRGELDQERRGELDEERPEEQRGERREDEVARDQHRKGQPPRLGPSLVLSGPQRVWPPLNPDAKPLPRPAATRPGTEPADTTSTAPPQQDTTPSPRADTPDTPSHEPSPTVGTPGAPSTTVDVSDGSGDLPGAVGDAQDVGLPQPVAEVTDARGGVNAPGTANDGKKGGAPAAAGDGPKSETPGAAGDQPKSETPETAGAAMVGDAAEIRDGVDASGAAPDDGTLETAGAAAVGDVPEIRDGVDAPGAAPEGDTPQSAAEVAEVPGSADAQEPGAADERLARPTVERPEQSTADRPERSTVESPERSTAERPERSTVRRLAAKGDAPGTAVPGTRGDRGPAAPGTRGDRSASFPGTRGDRGAGVPDARDPAAGDRRVAAASAGDSRGASSAGEGRAAAANAGDPRGVAASAGDSRSAAAGVGEGRSGANAGDGRAAAAAHERGGEFVAPVPVPRPGEGRVRRVESVVGRDSGGWRRIAQVVVGGGGVRTDGSEIDEARARGVFGGSRRIVVLGCTGGAGQSTTALMLGHTFAKYRDDRVVAVDANTGGGTLTSKIQPETPETLTSLLSGLDRVSGYLTMRGYTTRTASGLEVISADSDAGAEQRLADRSFFSDHRLGESMRLLDRHYKLAVIDPAAALAARLLPYADQLVLVVPASEEASEAVAMTYEWLDGHGCAELRRRAVMVVNGVSRRSMTDVEQAESVARGRCRAIVRVPWEDGLASEGAEVVDPGQLRAAGKRAYLALAGVVIAGFAAQAQTVRPSEEELASDPPGTRIGER